MKRRDFAIGNYVKFWNKDEWAIGRITGFNDDNNTIQVNYNYFSTIRTIDELKPIDIKVEWLDGFGFVDDCLYGLYYEMDKLYMINDTRNIAITIAENIQYIHELQNVFKVLKGIDLTLDFHKF